MNYSKKRSVHDIDLKNKKVLVRCDFNVPVDEKNRITDPKRINDSLKTIKYLLTQDCKIILCSHIGRPKGQFNKKFSLKPVAEYLSEKLGMEIKFSKDVIGKTSNELAKNLNCREILLLENLRYHQEETQNDEVFSKELASLAEIYVNDAFGTAHRAHASTVGVTKFLPSVIGCLVEKELEVLGTLFNQPEKPNVAILGGAKVSDKINVISKLLETVDILIIGGGMSYTFTNSLGYSVGSSICETDKIDVAKDIMTKAKEHNVKLILPVDSIVAESFSANASFKAVDADEIPEGWMGLDIGPKTRELFAQTIKSAKNIFWNGPMGVFEWENFSIGTKEVAKAVANSDATSIIGGGDSAAAVQLLGFADQITHISTGGGASLKFLEGAKLPAIEVIDNKN